MLLIIIPNLTMNKAIIGGTIESKITMTAKTIKPMDRNKNFFLKIPAACLDFTKNPNPLNIKIDSIKTIKK